MGIELGLDRPALDGVKNKLVDGRGLGLDRPALDGVKNVGSGCRRHQH